MSRSPLLEVRGLRKDFPVRTGRSASRRGRMVPAVAGVALDVGRGETLGLVGESGCGKSTLARCILRLLVPTAGTVRFEGRDLATVGPRELRGIRRRLQVVFQDPLGSLDPRMKVGTSVAEPLRVAGVARAEARARVRELLMKVGLDAEHAERYPHEFSSGQRQRIGIARALAPSPSLIVLDEPVSALDVSVQAGVLNLLADLRDELGLSYLFIAHDLAVVRHIADRVAVMYLGRIVETGPRDAIYDRPAHPYTQALLSAVPVPDPVAERQRRRVVLHGEVVGPAQDRSGCAFRTRCPWAEARCAEAEPVLVGRGPDGHLCACHLVTDPHAVGP